jgi:DNA-3-methyladenine glycosylase I
MIRYHDEEWGVPVHDDRKLFEYMVLDAFQAGLSWRTILNKRAGFDSAFAHFRPQVVAGFGLRDVERLMADPGIVRNRGKIESTIANARLVEEIQAEFGSLEARLWELGGGKTLVNRNEREADVPARSDVSHAMSQALRARGFTYVGPTVCYAFMQAAGMVNDHLVSCFRYAQLTHREFN